MTYTNLFLKMNQERQRNTRQNFSNNKYGPPNNKLPQGKIGTTKPESLICVLPSCNYAAWWCHFSIELILKTLALWNRMGKAG